MLNLIRSKKLCLQFRVQWPKSLQKYVITSKIGGHSSEGLYEFYKDYDNKVIEEYKKMNAKKFGISVITTPEECKECVKKLEKIDNIVAWDTETIDLDIKNQSPVGNGKIICASFFAGPQYSFGNGPKVFIDNFGKNSGLINYFKDYLQSQKYKKVWHNYGFDRHIFYNHGINVRGFGGDTMHMARLYDPAKSFGSYSLSSLTQEYEEGIRKYIKNHYIKKKMILNKKRINQSNSQTEKQQLQEQIKYLKIYLQNLQNQLSMRKIKMDSLFRRKKILKNGQEGKIYEFPTTLTLHTSEQNIKKWVHYSCLDAQSTFFLRDSLQMTLKNQKSNCFKGIENSWQIYERYWRPFGELLTDMERQGFKINLDYMKKIQQEAKQKIALKKRQFIQFLKTFQDDENIIHFNPSSNLQMQQLLHAPFTLKIQESQEMKKRKNQVQEDNQLKYLDNQPDFNDRNERDDGRKVSERTNIFQLTLEKDFRVEPQNPELYGNKKIQFTVKGLGIPPAGRTATGLPSVDQASLKILAGNPKSGKYGKAYEYFKQINEEQFGKRFCEAIGSLIEYKNIETLLVTFIQPLQSFTDKNGRIHCSLNINTQTGRLSSKKPNLQNQPALQKDIFKIRSAFTVEEGKKMIVADYGQLQLRVLAHITNCKGMIDAFQKGGDFHSRTAIGMFDYIKDDIQKGKVILEWDKSKGQAPAPLLKQKYAPERKKAKTVNFSIAYGKTAQGFAADWNCTVDEAKKVIEKWFKDRPEVKQWQKIKQQTAKKHYITHTLLGRVRNLSKLFEGGSYNKKIGMALRRAINTPIQGGAADIVIASMVKIHQDDELREMGWKLILQIHDELILEGPQQSVDRALEIVRHHMMHPFEEDLLIELQVDSKIGKTWYECK